MDILKVFARNVLFRASLQRSDVTHFLSYSELLGEKKALIFLHFLRKFVKSVMSLMTDLLKAKVEIFNNPIEVDIES